MAKVINRQLKIPVENFKKNLGRKVNPFKDIDETDEQTVSLNISQIDTDKQSDDNESFYQMNKRWHVQPGYDGRSVDISKSSKQIKPNIKDPNSITPFKTMKTLRPMRDID